MTTEPTGLTICHCGAGFYGTRGHGALEVRSHALFHAEVGLGPAHDPGLATFRPDAVTGNPSRRWEYPQLDWIATDAAKEERDAIRAAVMGHAEWPISDPDETFTDGWQQFRASVIAILDDRDRWAAS